MTNFDTFVFYESPPPTETELVEATGEVFDEVGDAETLISGVPADLAALSQLIVEDLLLQQLFELAGVVPAA